MAHLECLGYKWNSGDLPTSQKNYYKDVSYRSIWVNKSTKNLMRDNDNNSSISVSEFIKKNPLTKEYNNEES